MHQALARLSLLKSKVFQDVDDADLDAEFKLLLIAITGFVDMYTGHKVGNIGSMIQTTYTEERYTGNNTNELFLNHHPVTTLTTVALWDGLDSYDEETATNYELINQRYIQFPALGKEALASWNSWWGSYPNGIKITYTAGYVVDQTYDITDVNTGTKTFTVAEDVTGTYLPGLTFVIENSTGNDGTYTIVSATYGTDTDIVVSETVPDATKNGNISEQWDIASVTSPFNVPTDLEYAVLRIASMMWEEGKGGSARQGTLSKTEDISGVITYQKFLSGLSPDVEQTLRNYSILET